jgi:hypothetical protein
VDEETGLQRDRVAAVTLRGSGELVRNRVNPALDGRNFVRGKRRHVLGIRAFVVAAREWRATGSAISTRANALHTAVLRLDFTARTEDDSAKARGASQPHFRAKARRAAKRR